MRALAGHHRRGLRGDGAAHRRRHRIRAPRNLPRCARKARPPGCAMPCCARVQRGVRGAACCSMPSAPRACAREFLQPLRDAGVVIARVQSAALAAPLLPQPPQAAGLRWRARRARRLQHRARVCRRWRDAAAGATPRVLCRRARWCAQLEASFDAMFGAGALHAARACAASAGPRAMASRSAARTDAPMQLLIAGPGTHGRLLRHRARA